MTLGAKLRCFCLGIACVALVIAGRVHANEVEPLPLPVEEPSADDASRTRFPYVGAWRGHKPEGGFGRGTVVLISPSFALTARHVAETKAGDPGRLVELIFGEHKTTVAEVWLAPEGDVALLRFEKPLPEVTPVALLASPITPRHGRVWFTMIGHSGGLHAHADRVMIGDGGIDAWHEPGETGLPGKPGDSGGAWCLTPPDELRDAARAKDEPPPPDILIGIIHGSGRYHGHPAGKGAQPGVLRAWIDRAMKPSGEEARWVPFPKWAKRGPR